MAVASFVNQVIPGLNSPLTDKDMSVAHFLYNNSEHISNVLDIDDVHVLALLDIIERFGLAETFRVHRIHRHDIIPEGTIKLEENLGIMNGKWNRATSVQDLDFGNIHATVFKFVNGQATAYEFAEGPPVLGANATALIDDLIKEFSLYLEIHGLGDKVALEHGEFQGYQAKEILTEVDFDGVGTIALPESRVNGGLKVVTSWNVPPIGQFPDQPPPGQTWAPMVNESHKVFQNSLGNQSKLSTPDEVIEELLSQGIVQ
ncbi:hypothetical protein N7456_006930 [Penicillium angulare]|uniref:Uncharacterized protein n=1 Tax=Penicillium angulare TaxID=116970 RepID=A0A9W9FIT0_9EURO|nr:hypothetical protein N7456_006930 [Penicillium angulare]